MTSSVSRLNNVSGSSQLSVRICISTAGRFHRRYDVYSLVCITPATASANRTYGTIHVACEGYYDEPGGPDEPKPPVATTHLIGEPISPPWSSGEKALCPSFYFLLGPQL